ncbi:hypothetical protein KKC44_04140 [Patescibacteria group bacterium]|nr:hypothetical protein [Patescibacteria group bacterium]MBU2259771.1 hypothetical protein [Patescibacteria group bacterium]
MEDILTIADAQNEARESLADSETCWSQIVLRLQDCFTMMRQSAIDLLDGETVERLHVVALMERVTIDRIQQHALGLVDQEQPREALVYVRQQLSELRRRAQKVLCTPVLMKEAVVDFVEYLGEEGHEVLTLKCHANMCDLSWD